MRLANRPQLRPPFIMPGKERIAAIHGRSTDRVFHEVGVDIDVTVVQEQPEAVPPRQHIGQGFSEVRLA